MPDPAFSIIQKERLNTIYSLSTDGQLMQLDLRTQRISSSVNIKTVFNSTKGQTVCPIEDIQLAPFQTGSRVLIICDSKERGIFWSIVIDSLTGAIWSSLINGQAVNDGSLQWILSPAGRTMAVFNSQKNNSGSFISRFTNLDVIKQMPTGTEKNSKANCIINKISKTLLV